MEYVYAALLLHKLGKTVDVESITKIMQATGSEVDESKVKSLVASLKDVDIDKELETAVISATPVASGEASTESAPAEEKKEEKKEAAAEGLSALFG